MCFGVVGASGGGSSKLKVGGERTTGKHNLRYRAVYVWGALPFMWGGALNLDPAKVSVRGC